MDKEKIRFNALTMFFLPHYLVYHRCYLGCLITLIANSMLGSMLGAIPKVGWLLYMVVALTIGALWGEAITAYFQNQKRESLERKGKTEDEINILLAPSWTPVFIYIGISVGIFVLLILFIFMMAIAIGFLAAAVG